MKAAPFDYRRPSTVDDVVAELAAGDGKVLAGGQSLVPLLAMRLARPPALVDINAVAGLDAVGVLDGMLRIGATVRQRQAEGETRVPLLGMALPYVGHRELRSRGTICGSLMHADPAAELPAVASCLDARLELTGPGGARAVRAREFFRGAMTTAAGPHDLLTAVRFPVAESGDGFGFAEVARRHGDFALAGVAVHLRVRAGRLVVATLTGFGISDRPVTHDVRSALSGVVDAGEPALRERITPLAESIVDTEGDAHGSRDYRCRVFVSLAARELLQVYQRLCSVEGES